MIEAFGFDERDSNAQLRTVVRNNTSASLRGPIHSHYFNATDGTLLVAEERYGLRKLRVEPLKSSIDGTLQQI